MTRAQALALVNQARERAESFRAEGSLDYTSADPDCPQALWLAALMEELGEVARAVHDGDEDALAEELAHLAGVAVGKLETL